ncbi:MAG: SCO family protein [Verrucomicrobiota bacterium]|nr:SCO family protein [Verrucomicrobiota bacterium]
MRSPRMIPGVLALGLLLSWPAKSGKNLLPPPGGNAPVRVFAATGVVESLQLDDKTAVIRNDAISNFMAAMTMPFQVKDAGALAGLKRGDKISFRLHVTRTESWIDRIVKIGAAEPAASPKAAEASPAAAPPPQRADSILDYAFTNELGRPVRLNDFHGQALAVTFFYTRCPLPDYCPRLSKNFQEASQKLEAMAQAPTNWHFISVSFDPAFDTPSVLKAYGQSYDYDPKHWSFLTGPPDKIAELARAAGVAYEAEGGTIKHNFRTLIVDATGHLQMIFPTGGDLSGEIVSEILKAAAVTNQMVSQNQNR